MSIPVKLPVFEGPLDLLLHLIDKNKVDIYDIPIVEITDQYMGYIHQMEREDLGIMSEFMVMAATLMDIKCKMLLPAPVQEESEEEDPRAELVAKLLEYKMYKYMSYELRERLEDAKKHFYKRPTIPAEVAGYRQPVSPSELLADITLPQLNKLFCSVMKKREDKLDPIRSRFGKIEQEETSLSDKLRDVREYIRVHRRSNFFDLLEKQASKMQVVVTFLAILELMKMGDIRIIQEHIFDEIKIEAVDA